MEEIDKITQPDPRAAQDTFVELKILKSEDKPVYRDIIKNNEIHYTWYQQ